MLMVEPAADRVEEALRAGELACPDCAGELGPWGSTPPRHLWSLIGRVLLPKRRSRCRACGKTHVLEPTSCLSRRVHLAEVIGEALRLKAAGSGHRAVAAELGVAPTTVRGWLRRFATRAERIRAHFTGWAYHLDPSLGEIAPRASPFADAMEAVAVAHRAAAGRLGPSPVWAFASGATAGLLLCNTDSPFPAPR